MKVDPAVSNRRIVRVERDVFTVTGYRLEFKEQTMIMFINLTKCCFLHLVRVSVYINHATTLYLQLQPEVCIH